MARQKRRTPFWDEIEERLKGADAGLNSMKALANALKVPEGSLWPWKHEGRFPRALLPEMIGALPWPELTEELAEQLQVEWIENYRPRQPSHSVPREKPEPPLSPFEQELQVADREYMEFRKACERYAEHTARVFGALDGQSYFAFTSCTTMPYEIRRDVDQGEQTAEAIARAIAKGVLCLYIFPTRKGARYYSKGWGFHETYTHEQYRLRMNTLRERLRRILHRDGLTAADADRRIAASLNGCFVNRSPMWMPGVGLSIAGRRLFGSEIDRVMVSLPGSRFGGILVYPNYEIIQIRMRRFVRQVAVWAQVAASERKHGRAGGGKVMLDLPDDAGREQFEQAERFFDRYHSRISGLDAMDDGEEENERA